MSFLFILVAPLTVEVFPKEYKVAASLNSSQFTCFVSASSVPNITWRVWLPQFASTVSEDQFTISETNHQIVDGKPMYSSVFTLNKTLPRYSGQYTCSATTKEDGNVAKIGSLEVTSKPIHKTEMITDL